MGWSVTLHRNRMGLLAGASIAIAAALLVGLATVAGAYPATLTSAARSFETAVANGGPGFRFEVVQRQTEDAKPGGSPIPVLDSANPKRYDLDPVTSWFDRRRSEQGYTLGFSCSTFLFVAGPQVSNAV